MAATPERRTIRGQLTRIVLIPSVCFLLLWTAATAAGAVQAASMAAAVGDGRAGTAAFTRLAEALRQERLATMVRLGDPGGDAADAPLERARSGTDRALERAEPHAEELRSGADRDVLRSAARFDGRGEGAPEDVEELRGGVDGGSVTRATALEAYDALLDDLRTLDSALLDAAADGADGSAAGLAETLVGVREEYSRAEALLAGAIAAEGMDYQETAHFTYLTASYRDALEQAEPDLRGPARDAYTELASGDAWRRTERLSRGVVTRPPVSDEQAAAGRPAWNTGLDVGADEWERAAGRAGEGLRELVATQRAAVFDGAETAAHTRIALSVAGAVLTLAAGAAAIIVAGRSSRRLTERLCRLRTETLAVSDTRLPRIVSRVQEGGRVDLGDALPQLSYGTDEIGEVADAFNTAQRTAVGAAVKQAEIRAGANRVFLGIAYRNQALVQRQLRLLDEIEYAEEDPRTLDKLFRLDHLATRARRYADNLIILGGAHSARRWREPMPVVDALRAAISETEDYQRVRLTCAPGPPLRGTAVADVVHLVAELVENATQFSPAGAPVDVICGPAPGGMAVEVEDRGLGLTPEGYAAAERTLAQAPEFDVMALQDEPRVGLFVVARLAARHGIAVRLAPSAYGGARATVLVPAALLEEAVVAGGHGGGR
ncbi:sensor histidine kinase [Nocardiopsis suaedae]|uniref:histidine kinase n=1 Tax=Nocardiopsis suaedae TaxID=3018444 RepID=A0ABT4TVJ2_9ACTN|nr:nitrate- and nitrite sensing domain-containing protein [Nocardiopsis suaedae]MDA2808727.1 nitrate- and nitrite sensing domain-containing protein [Nocardiopsis suaedae]